MKTQTSKKRQKKTKINGALKRRLSSRFPGVRAAHHESRMILDEAMRFLVGGVNSPVRAFRHVGGEPLFFSRSKTDKVFDVAGRAYIDFIMGWGSLILGHTHPSVVRVLSRSIKMSTMLGLTHPLEVGLAKLIAEALPSVEQVRFTASGTEACLTAIRLARAVTGRAKILSFEGCYHGHSDSVMAHTSAGIPESLRNDALRVAFNDPDAFESAIERNGKSIAAVIIEPVSANMGVVIPRSGYLERIREVTAREGILLIFDEVVTGFRVGLSGAQGRFGIRADLTTLGKIIGGGLPIGAVGGPSRIMGRLAPEGDAYHAGTFAGHPLSMAAGVATLGKLRADPPYARLERATKNLTAELGGGASEEGIGVQINRMGSMFTLFFSEDRVENATQATASDRGRFAKWANALREQGVLVPPSPTEALFTSTAHKAGSFKCTIEASRKAMRLIAKER